MEKKSHLALLEKMKKSLRPELFLDSEIADFIDKINSKIKKKKIKAVCTAGGSIAKGTFLKEDFDVDLFVRFDYSYKEKDISCLLKEILEGLPFESIHGSRDYYQVHGKYNFEIVPVLDVKDPKMAINVTDMSPLHVAWVEKNLKKGQEDEIRLAKKFCKAIGVYGAESYISGFSGHVIDILIINYGSFLSLLEASKKWKAPLVIDTEGHYKSPREILFSMNQSKVQGPMICIDPILKARNASSSLSYEKFSLFKKKAAEFLKKPSEKFFTEEKTGKEQLKKIFRKNLLFLDIKLDEGKKDVIGGRIVKVQRFIKSGLQKEGFKIKDSGWQWSMKKRALLWYALHQPILPETRIVEGPPAGMKEHTGAFRKKYRKCFEKSGRLYGEEKIKERHAGKIAGRLAESSYFKEKAELIRIVFLE